MCYAYEMLHYGQHHFVLNITLPNKVFYRIDKNNVLENIKSKMFKAKVFAMFFYFLVGFFL